MSIKRFSFGKIIDCNSVVKKIEKENGQVPYFLEKDSVLLFR
jgi:alpha-glucosidase